MIRVVYAPVDRRFQIILAILSLASPSWGQQPSVAERIAQVLAGHGVLEDDDLASIADVAESRRMARELLGAVDEFVAITAPRREPELSHRRRGGWRFTTADRRFSMRIGGRVAVRAAYDVFDRNPGTNDEDEPGFANRLRLRFDGHAFEPWLTYRIMLSVSGDEATTVIDGVRNESTNLLMEAKDIFADAAFDPAFRIRFGQFRVPYGRQPSSGLARVQFVGRSITDRAFSRNRDVGMMVHGGVGGPDADLFQWSVGAFNGERENRPNDDRGLLWSARAVVSPFGAIPYRESDVDDTEDLQLSIGLSAWLHEDDAHLGRGDDWSAGIDLALRWRGAFLLAEWHVREDAQSGPDARLVGWVIQGSYFVVRKTLELGLRAAHVDWDHTGDGTTAAREYLGVIGWYLEGHSMKLQLDFGRVIAHFGDHADDVEGWQVRMQFQLMF